MTIRLIVVFLISNFFLVANTAAQMSVTTIGATDAAECYENASSGFISDTGPCDAAIKDTGMTKRDIMKTYVNRGIIHNHNRDLQAAIDDFNAALEMDDDLAEAYLNRGNSHFLARQFDNALADYETALAQDISKPWAAWYNIGLVYDAQKLTAKAQEAYAEALTLNPSFTPAQEKLKDSD